VVVDDVPVPLGLEGVAVDGVLLGLGREELEVHRLPAIGPMPEATNISHKYICARAAGVLGGRNWPDFSARYKRMALLSNTLT
jgi:hypothetical protein